MSAASDKLEADLAAAAAGFDSALVIEHKMRTGELPVNTPAGQMMALLGDPEAKAYGAWKAACQEMQRAYLVYKTAAEAEAKARVELGNIVAPAP